MKPLEDLDDAIEKAVSYGWHRAHKHMDNPDEESIKATIVAAVRAVYWENVDPYLLQLSAEKVLRFLKHGDPL